MNVIKRNTWLRLVAQDSETAETVSPEGRQPHSLLPLPAFSQTTRNIQLLLNGGRPFCEKIRGNGLGRMGKRTRLLPDGVQEQRASGPSTMKMENAASMTPEMAGTCTGSAFSAGLSQYMERDDLEVIVKPGCCADDHDGEHPIQIQTRIDDVHERNHFGEKIRPSAARPPGRRT